MEYALFFMRNPRYARALQFLSDPDTFAREIRWLRPASDFRPRSAHPRARAASTGREGSSRLAREP
jgi:hypothetical protein